MYRERVLDLYHDGFGNRQIAREIRSSPGFVQKVIDRYNEQNTSLRGIRVGVPSPKIDEQVSRVYRGTKTNETEHLLDRITTEAST